MFSKMSNFVWKSQKKLVTILLPIEILSHRINYSLGFLATYLCNELDVLRFFNSIHLLYLAFVVYQVINHLIVVLNFSKYWWKFSHQAKCQVTNRRSQIILVNIFHFMSLTIKIFLSSTQYVSTLALFTWDIQLIMNSHRIRCCPVPPGKKYSLSSTTDSVNDFTEDARSYPW